MIARDGESCREETLRSSLLHTHMAQDRHKAHFGRKRRLSKTLPKQVGPPGLAHQLEKVRAAECSQRLNHCVHIHQEQHALGSKRELLLLRHMVQRIQRSFGYRAVSVQPWLRSPVHYRRRAPRTADRRNRHWAGAAARDFALPAAELFSVYTACRTNA